MKPIDTLDAIDATKREKLLKDGFCIFEHMLDQSMLNELRRVTQSLIAQVSAGDSEKYKYQGTNVQVNYQDPVFAKLFALPAVLNALSGSAKVIYGHCRKCSGFYAKTA